jgi:hypothetical protein
MFQFLRLLASLLIGSALASLAWAAPAGLPRILGSSAPGDRVFAKADSHAMTRARAARPDMEAIADIAARAIDLGEKPRFVLDLFPDLELEAETLTAERRASGATIIARLTGVEMGTAVLTLEQGVLTATANYVGASFLVTVQPDGTYRVSEVDQARFPPEAPPLVSRIAAPAAPTAPRASASDVPVDSGRLVDIMVVWTAAAETAAGGFASMQSLAQSAVDTANAAYLNSGIAQRLRLVYKGSVVYAESSSGSTMFNTALTDVTSGSISATVGTLRNTWGADMVSMFIKDDASICGLAWLLSSGNPAVAPGPDPAHAFSVVAQGCAVGNLSFPHEVGHNMGAHHDPYVLNAGPCGDLKEIGAYCYSRGFSHIGASAPASWRTIMAYNNDCAAHVGSCTRLPYFSNPNVKYSDGNPMGDATYRNNALTLNKTAKAIAAYKATVVGVACPACTYPAYADVATSNAFYGYVEFMREAAYTGGCAPGMYCPNDPVTRGQMAAFLERAKRTAKSTYSWPATGTVFTDVPAGAQFAGFIEALYNDGITSGCTGTTYCPDDPVRRDQMAKFILKGKCGSAYVPMARTSTFADVPTGSTFADYIMKLSTLQVTSGCAVGLYCPAAAVTRAEMAKFLEKAFPFGYPSDICTP